MQIEIIETSRLRGERVCESHWNLWFEMGRDSRVMATLGGIWNPGKAVEKLYWNCEQWVQYGHGLWMLFDKATGSFTGRAGIRKVVVNANEEVELGYALMPEYWGKGLAVEIGQKALSVAFEQFHYSNVVCFTLTDNKQSERVMQKLGFTYESNIIHHNEPHVLYRYQNPAT
ncbi:GNAT family N-acetyltransferase [Chlorogloeopsis sp. ULAP02]|uniref:GNAT family N-acetyltransferase n=1 Tax=Chlorogloeopsis sp. ULAP02 TaxID=3107926 RepID=UPI0031375493